VTTTAPSIQDRIISLDWAAMTSDLDSFGCTIVKSVLTREECRSIAAMYERDDIFRSTIVMARHGFGRGEYKYWSYPLPEIVAGLRTALYPPLAAVANRWNQSMKIDVRYPETHEEYLERCHAASQTRPTPSCSVTMKATGMRCIRMSTARMSFPFRSPFFCQNPARISRAASSY
jgi:uncharacterized protein